MYARTVLLSVAAGGLLLTQAGAASAAQETRIGSSFVGSARVHMTPTEQCLVPPTKPADLLCRFDTTVTFRNGHVHGVRQGALHVDYTNTQRTGCESVTGYLTDYVFSNNGRFLGSFREHITKGQSCLTPTDGIEAQSLTTTIVGGTKAFKGQQGSVTSSSATARPVNQGDPIVIAGTFVATLVR